MRASERNLGMKQEYTNKMLKSLTWDVQMLNEEKRTSIIIELKMQKRIFKSKWEPLKNTPMSKWDVQMPQGVLLLGVHLRVHTHAYKYVWNFLSHIHTRIQIYNVFLIWHDKKQGFPYKRKNKKTKDLFRRSLEKGRSTVTLT